MAEQDLLDGLDMEAGSADRTRLLAAWAARYGMGLVERIRELTCELERAGGQGRATD